VSARKSFPSCFLTGYPNIVMREGARVHLFLRATCRLKASYQRSLASVFSTFRREHGLTFSVRSSLLSEACAWPDNESQHICIP
jgi:hypothetical protein